MGQFFKFVFASCLGTLVAAFLVIMFGWIIAIGIASKASSTAVSVKPNSVLKVEFNYPVPEKTNNFAQSSFSIEEREFVGLQDAIRLIEKAKEDPNIKGIHLKTGMLNAGQSTMLALRRAVDDFKTSGKFVTAYDKYYDQNGYLVASAADVVMVHPIGTVDFRGYASMMPFFKDGLDKLGVKMEIFYAGQYKSATEPFRLNKMSDQNRQQVKEYLDDLYRIFLEQVSTATDKSTDSLRTIADQFLVRNGDDAIRYGLVDKLAYEDDAEQVIKDKIGLGEKDKVNLVTLEDYKKASGTLLNYSVKDRIAIVYAEGEIRDFVDEEGVVGGDKYARILRRIKNDDRIKAVVLRVNSPGGSILASEDIAEEIISIRKAGKPVIASYGDLAASGGYYISCHADKIVSEPNTLTGSIGVFMMMPNMTQLFNEKLGIHFDTVKTGEYSASFSPVLNWSERESQIIQAETDRNYELFLSQVAEGRQMTKDQVHAIAQGRVWTGTKAKELGLVDEIGGLDRALELAAEASNLTKYSISEYPAIKDQVTRVMELISGKKDETVNAVLKSKLGHLYPLWQMWEHSQQGRTPMARLPYMINY